MSLFDSEGFGGHCGWAPLVERANTKGRGLGDEEVAPGTQPLLVWGAWVPRVSIHRDTGCGLGGVRFLGPQSHEVGPGTGRAIRVPIKLQHQATATARQSEGIYDFGELRRMCPLTPLVPLL